jgi:signal transduction histidine kinase
MRSLALKLVLAFTLVSLVGIALVAIMAARFTGDQFRELLEAQDNDALISELSEYYSRDGSWKGIGRLTNRQAFSQRYGRGFVIFNAQGEIIVPDPDVFPAPRIQGMDRWREDGTPITIDNQVVGIIFRGPNRFQGAPPFSAQFTRLYNSLIIASVGAVLASLILGVVLARTLTRTLRELTDASRAIAKGDLKQQVPIRSQDELGELAASFNQMSSDLAQSQELRRQMTADIAHELRTPLTVVLGHSEALSEGQLPPDPETFDIIYDETKRLNRLVDDLRTLSLSDAGELRLNRSRISPLELLERSAAARKSEANTKGVSLLIETSPGLPEVKVDADRMTQVLVNLLDNALRYTLEGGRITLSGTQIPEGVRIAVEDTGPGIPEQDLPFLFDRFYRGDKSRQREEGGSGLGLAIARSLVESQGGRIRVESKVGVGAKFIIELPIAHEQTAEGESN